MVGDYVLSLHNSAAVVICDKAFLNEQNVTRGSKSLPWLDAVYINPLAGSHIPVERITARQCDITVPAQ